MPHPNKWLQIDFLLLAKITAYAVFQRNYFTQLFHSKNISCVSNLVFVHRNCIDCIFKNLGACVEQEERSSKALFKIEKILLILEKMALIVFYFGLDFKFKMQFWQNLREKAPKIVPEREFSKLFAFFFLGFEQKVYRSALNPLNLPCPKKFLVAGLWRYNGKTIQFPSKIVYAVRIKLLLINDFSFLLKNQSCTYCSTLLNVRLLANSANTKCRPFQVNIICSKFVIDRLQQQCHVTFSIYLFVTSRNFLFGVFLPRKIITVSRKIAVNFREVSLKGVSLSKRSGMFWQNLLKVPVKKLNL